MICAFSSSTRCAAFFTRLKNFNETVFWFFFHFNGNGLAAPLRHAQRLHHAGPHCCHLRAVAGAGNGCHDVAAKRGPRLQERAVFRAYLKAGAVSGEAGAEPVGDPGARSLPMVVAPKEHGLRLVGYDELSDDARVGQGAVVLQKRRIAGSRPGQRHDG